MSEQMRSEFEAWAKAQGRTCKREGEGYSYSVTDSEWQAWQASRVALFVELPKLSDQPAEDHYNWSACEQKCRDAIHAAGVKAK